MYLQGQSYNADILDSWKDKNGKFVRTFGMNSKRNENKWLATWESIKENIHTALGMPGIAYENCDEAGCSLDHVEADSFEEQIEKQKPFIVTKIIDYIFDESTETVDLIHEVVNDEFFEQLEKTDDVKFVSPLIWPTNNGLVTLGAEKNKNGVLLPVQDAHHWKFAHHAFLNKEPAYGNDVAQVKTTCEGDNCQVQMLSAKLTADTAIGNDDNISHLKETPLLVKHKGNLHLVAGTQCVKDILHKKKQDGIKIDDKQLAIAYNECYKSNKANTSFKTCTCESKHNMSAEEVQIKKENEDLKAKLKAMEDHKEEEKTTAARKAKYASLFADTTEDEREKLVAKLKGMDEDDEHKAAMEVHEEMKSKKANNEDDKEKSELKARLSAMEKKSAEPMIKSLIALRAGTMTKDDLQTFTKSLQGKSFAQIEEKYNEDKPLMGSTVNVETSTISDNFEFNGGQDISSLKGKTFSEISGGQN